MTDVAALGFSVDSNGLVSGADALDRVARSSKSAASAADDFGKTSTKSGAGASKLAQEAAKVADGLNMAGRATSAAIGTTNSAGKEWVKASSAAGQMRMEASRAGVAVNELAASADKAGAAASRMARQAQDSAAGMGKTSGAGRVLSMQLSQVAQQAAAGGSALRALAIQLPDIAVGMSMAGKSAGALARFFGGPWGIALASAAAVLVPLIERLFDTRDAADTARGALQALIEKRRETVAGVIQLGKAEKELNIQRDQRLQLLTRIDKAEALLAKDTSANARTARASGIARLNAQLRAMNDNITEGEAAVRAERAVQQAASKTTTEKATATSRASRATGAHTAAMKAASQAAREAQREYQNLIDILDDLAGLFGDIRQTTLKMFDVAQAKAWSDAMQAANDNIDARQQKLRDATDANAAFNDEIRRTIDLLDQVGARDLGSILAAFQGLATGDFSGVPGKGGALLQQLAGIQWVTDNGRMVHRLGEEFHKALTGVFGESFGPTLINLFQGAATGAAVGGIVFGSKSSQLGATAGGAIGGAFSKDIAKAVDGVGGQILGALAPIAGSLIGGLIGGLFKKNKTGKATFGDDLSVFTSGNSSSRTAQASSLAGGVIDSLQNIANALGADLGTFTGTIGIRNKSLRYDPTGGGNTKTSKGAIDFGQDQEALLKAVIKDAISDGVFEGLSDGIERLLKGEGDIEKQLQKALDLSNVMASARSLADPSGAAIAELDKWRDRLIAIATEAGEGMADVEAVYAAKRKDIVEAAAQEAYEAMRPRRELEIQILALEGKEVEALAAARKLELDGMDESLRPLQQRIYALQDEAARIAEVNAVHERMMAERETLNQQLWQAMGREDLLRQAALRALDPANKHLQEWVWRVEDANKAAQEAARAEEARASERAGLENQLLQLQGDIAALRARELAALDPANRAIQERIFALQDEAAAAQTAAAIASERYSLETRLYNALGDTAMLRARELASIDPANRAILERIYAIEDAQAAEQQAAAARNELISSYRSEASALESTASKFRDFAQTIREFRDGLFVQAGGGSYASALSQFNKTSRMAGLGNETSLANFTRDAQAFLDAAKANAGSFTEYQRAIALVSRGASGAIKGAEGVASAAEQQIRYLEMQAASLEQISSGTQATEDAIAALAELEKGELFPSLESTLEDKIDALKVEIERGRVQSREAAEMAQTALEAAVIALNNISRRTTNWDRGDYVSTGNDSDTPITVTGSVSALVTNTGAAQAVPVDTTP